MSNEDLANVIDTDKVEEMIFNRKFPNEEFNPDDYNDWVSENSNEAYQLCLEVAVTLSCR